MVTYMAIPNNKLTLGATTLENTLESAKVTRVLNGFDTATIVLPDTSYYPTTVTQGTTISLEVKEAGGAYTTIFAGIVRFVIADIGANKTLTLSCLGTGFGLGEMLVCEEYGSQSKVPTTNTLAEIIGDLTTNQINTIFGAGGLSSGFSYTNSCTLANSIPYIMFPYKTADKCLNDLIDLVTAQEAGSAGPQWIVTTDSVIHVNTIGVTQGTWYKYYGNSQANATLTYGVDYFNINLEKMAPEANYIVYYGSWRRPSNGDVWTENNHADWDDGSGATYTDDTTTKIVGAYSVKCHNAAGTGCGFVFTFPETIDFTYFTSLNTPSLIFDLATNTAMTLNPGAGIYTNFFIRLFDSTSDYFYINPGNDFITDALTFRRFNASVGYFNKDKWLKSGTPEWNDIVSVEIWCPKITDAYLDGFHFGEAAVCRVAYNSTSITATGAKMRLIVDNIGKDDTVTSGTLGTTDIGLMAQLAYSELLRLQTSSLVGTVETPMIADLLPGQYLYIQTTDFRVPKIVHNISKTNYSSLISITDDLTNGRARLRYEDINKQWSAIRPEFQDRQASSIKASSIDLRVTRLAENYG
jgi:hypothetical protein